VEFIPNAELNMSSKSLFMPAGRRYSSSLAGAQPKIAMVEVEGKCYAEGNSPDQQLERYLMCEDLEEQGSVCCKRKIEEGVVGDNYRSM
jgi:hypothetical protein